MPADPANDCISVGNQTYRGIQEAKPTAIAVEMDVGENGSLGSPDENEIIRYAYDVADQYITRSSNCGSPQPFLGADPATAPAGTRTVTVQNKELGINNGAGTPTPAIFRYYDSNGPSFTRIRRRRIYPTSEGWI